MAKRLSPPPSWTSRIRPALSDVPHAAILVADEAQNPEFLWAARGGGTGQYGVVSKYIIKANPQPGNRDAAALLASVPDLMDGALTGTGMISAGALPVNSSQTVRKVTASIGFVAYNTTDEEMTSLLEPVRARVLAEVGDHSVTVTLSKPASQPGCMTFFESLNQSPGTFGAGMMRNRFLGRKELADIPVSAVASYLQHLNVPRNPTGSPLMVIDLQGGLGPRNVSNVLPPCSGSHMNEGNAFGAMFKEDFYGTSYDRLVDIKRKYDPTESLFILWGVGSDAWESNLSSGKFCKTV
ncbi:FAD-dependent monooxygenase [Colletotrichum orchidophilum]|uniref:FAD-dependent monooxygenase n=1 Tax=Colletotrichum orchidophilum TaxID=1209926 RepID=A0A1G4BM77_9PEZI|nr:FAD-dependent monooxygenase [Colletotrichum orchidophilum]OHF02408.1 FAD-dependent monooxygenase [Colletotrichum orchidophilum]